MFQSSHPLSLSSSHRPYSNPLIIHHPAKHVACLSQSYHPPHDPSSALPSYSVSSSFHFLIIHLPGIPSSQRLASIHFCLQPSILSRPSSLRLSSHPPIIHLPAFHPPSSIYSSSILPLILLSSILYPFILLLSVFPPSIRHPTSCLRRQRRLSLVAAWLTRNTKDKTLDGRARKQRWVIKRSAEGASRKPLYRENGPRI